MPKWKMFTRGEKSGGAHGIEPSCSFCSKQSRDVRSLITAPNANICDECVAICVATLAQQGRAEGPDISKPGPGAPESAAIVNCALCRYPIPAADAILVSDLWPLCLSCIRAVGTAQEHAEHHR